MPVEPMVRMVRFLFVSSPDLRPHIKQEVTSSSLPAVLIDAYAPSTAKGLEGGGAQGGVAVVMVLDSGEVFMDQVAGESVGSSGGPLAPDVRAEPPKAVAAGRSNVTKKGRRVSQNGLPAQTDSTQVVERRSSASSVRSGATPRPSLRRPPSLEMTPHHVRGFQEQMADRRIVQPPWRSGSAAPSLPARSLTSPSLGAGGWMRRSESTCSVNYLRSGRGQMRPATSLPHIAKGSGASSLPAASRPCLLVALRPLNLEQEKQKFFESDFRHEPQFEYMQPEPRSVLEKYRDGSGLFLEQVQYVTHPSHL